MKWLNDKNMTNMSYFQASEVLLIINYWRLVSWNIFWLHIHPTNCAILPMLRNVVEQKSQKGAGSIVYSHGIAFVYDQIMTTSEFTDQSPFSLSQSKLKLCSANHRPGNWSNLPCGWPSTARAYSKQETENGPSPFLFMYTHKIYWI